ncbi:MULTISPECIES: branched-chain amino acid aminotransferase [Catellatospora]|uniref:Branched-chain-amino-acid aminotransferase n=2 Tax=Catellatospora TaxID=53365 RepID=A0A8J3KHT1_9ACTN|nr:MULTISPECIES: branched-chain amino acid aminotransferase [Catellatospora]RKE09844.1 branched-chain amino acid aminotransferase [Catellatospora citrea]GIF94687.1 branched-chain-amino-acid aminotransferase [Catellatospora chokoriensis]GIG03188.1 branched-chain-amino-acid aminotransferase [Catellatospora citrea]
MSGGGTIDFEIRPSSQPVSATEREALLANPGFGRIFTDHMVTIRYAEGKGWYDARVEARAPIPMDPATAVLHYAQEIFEGMKAYRRADGQVGFFRPDANARRFAASAQRMAMAPLPEELFLDSIRQLVGIDQEWIPTSAEGSLYLRPFQYASEVFLGVRPAREYLYCVIASPVGPYFSGGLKPVTIWVSDDYTRAAPGGTGAAKCGGNYAASLLAQAQAAENGCDQVVYLDAVERKYVDELGGMNVFFVRADGSMFTPELNGSILPGITRDSIIQLAREQGRQVQERPVTIDEWRDGARSGEIVETFACGTAAVLTPIGTVRGVDGEFKLGDGGTGPVTAGLRQSLVDIQYGRAADPYGWTTTL